MQNSKFSSAGEALQVCDEISVLTFGKSMRPMLRQHKDVVIIKRVDRALKKGDVVLYPGANNSFVLHRIVKIKDGELVIRGDNNFFTERDVKRENVVGILKEFYRGGKYIDCNRNFGYKLYTFYIVHSYGLRYFLRMKVRSTLGKIKRFILRK